MCCRPKAGAIPIIYILTTRWAPYTPEIVPSEPNCSCRGPFTQPLKLKFGHPPFTLASVDLLPQHQLLCSTHLIDACGRVRSFRLGTQTKSPAFGQRAKSHIPIRGLIRGYRICLRTTHPKLRNQCPKIACGTASPHQSSLLGIIFHPVKIDRSQQGLFPINIALSELSRDCPKEDSANVNHTNKFSEPVE